MAVSRWLPQWAGRLTPHVLRHFCASSLYARGMDLKATRYIHVPAQHVEQAWMRTNARAVNRLLADGVS